MGKVKKEDIMDIVEKYDKSNITIATLGSHTALHILRGAKQEGFRTAVVCEKGKEVPYERFGVADEFIFVDEYQDTSYTKFLLLKKLIKIFQNST